MLPYYHIDAFTSELFRGNPAAVMPLTEWLPDAQLLQLATENALPETAFFVPVGEQYELRWFTPDIEMDLCGHATVATAHVLAQHLGQGSGPFVFQTRSGELRVTVAGDWYTLDFPSRPAQPATLPPGIAEAFNYPIREVLKARDYVLLFDYAEQVRDLRPDRAILD